MPKRYSKKDLETKVLEYKAQLEKQASCYATSDGQFFKSNKESAANYHAKENKLTVYKIEVPEVEVEVNVPTDPKTKRTTKKPATKKDEAKTPSVPKTTTKK